MPDFDDVKVGDEIVVRVGFSRRIEKRTVERVTNTRFVDSRGNQWTKAGKRWGSAGCYGPFSCEAYDPDRHGAELQKIELEDLRHSIRATPMNDLSDDQVKRIWAIIQEPNP